MSFISLQDIYFFTMLFSALISLAGAVLFYSAFKVENALQVPWRAIGFGSLSLAFLCALIQIKWPLFYEVQLLLEAFGFIGIYRGMTVDPYVSYLQKASSVDFDQAVNAGMLRNKNNEWVRRGLSQFADTKDPDVGAFTALFITLVLSIIFSFAGLPIWLNAMSFVSLGVALVYIIRTIFLQVHRLITEKSGKKVGIHNVIALAAYAFFVTRYLLLVLELLPIQSSLAALSLTEEVISGMSIFATFAGLLCVALWLWPFVRARASIFAYIIAGSLAILLAAVFFIVLR